MMNKAIVLSYGRVLQGILCSLTGSSYGYELEINYFEKKEKW